MVERVERVEKVEEVEEVERDKISGLYLMGVFK